MAFTATYPASEPARADVEAYAGATVLEFGAPWCGWCLGAQAAIQEALSAHPGVRHVKVEDGRGKPLGRSYRIKLWPTLVFLRDGVEQARAVRPGGTPDILEGLAAIDRPADA